MSPALLVYKQLWKCALKFIISSKNKENFVLMCHVSFLGTKRLMYITGLQCCHKHVPQKKQTSHFLLTFYHRIMKSSQELVHLFHQYCGWLYKLYMVCFFFLCFIAVSWLLEPLPFSHQVSRGSTLQTFNGSWFFESVKSSCFLSKPLGVLCLFDI